MNIAILIIAAVCGYLVSGLNPAIIMSKTIYHEDIREKGSKNPGFTNFKRVYGMKWAWLVMLLDLSKALILELIFGLCFKKIFGENAFALGAAYTGVFAMLGHAYPVWYKFKGGKAYLVCLSTLYMVSWKAGLISTIMMVILLLSTKYMSLATLVGLVTGIVVMPFFGVRVIPLVLCLAGVCFVIYRHKENIKRLASGNESKFSFKKKKQKGSEQNNNTDNKAGTVAPEGSEQKSSADEKAENIQKNSSSEQMVSEQKDEQKAEASEKQEIPAEAENKDQKGTE